MYAYLRTYTHVYIHKHIHTCIHIHSLLGAGLRCGFLGFLHMEVVMQRLKDEFGINVIMTTPSVPYMVDYGDDDQGKKQIVEILSVSEWPQTTGGQKKMNFKVIFSYC